MLDDQGEARAAFQDPEHPHIRHRRPEDDSERSGAAVVTVPDILTVNTRGAFQAACTAALQTGVRHLLLSFERCHRIDSAGIGYLVRLRRETLDAGVTLTCCRCSPDLHASFRLALQHDRLQVRPDDLLEPW